MVLSFLYGTFFSIVYSTCQYLIPYFVMILIWFIKSVTKSFYGTTFSFVVFVWLFLWANFHKKKVFSSLCIIELVATNSNMIFDVSACFVFATFLFCATRMVLWFMTQQIGEFRIILVILLHAFRLSRISSKFQLIFIATLVNNNPIFYCNVDSFTGLFVR